MVFLGLEQPTSTRLRVGTQVRSRVYGKEQGYDTPSKSRIPHPAEYSFVDCDNDCFWFVPLAGLPVPNPDPVLQPAVLPAAAGLEKEADAGGATQPVEDQAGAKLLMCQRA